MRAQLNLTKKKKTLTLTHTQTHVAVPIKMYKFIHAFALSEACRILMKKVILEKKYVD